MLRDTVRLAVLIGLCDAHDAIRLALNILVVHWRLWILLVDDLRRHLLAGIGRARRQELHNRRQLDLGQARLVVGLRLGLAHTDPRRTVPFVGAVREREREEAARGAADEHLLHVLVFAFAPLVGGGLAAAAIVAAGIGLLFSGFFLLCRRRGKGRRGRRRGAHALGAVTLPRSFARTSRRAAAAEWRRNNRRDWRNDVARRRRVRGIRLRIEWSIGRPIHSTPMRLPPSSHKRQRGKRRSRRSPVCPRHARGRGLGHLVLKFFN